MLKKLTNFFIKILSGNKNITGISMDNKLVEQKANTVNNVAVQNNSMYGITYTEARQIAIDVFQQNFPRLHYEAEQIANMRIMNFISKYIPQIPENFYYKFADPDIQYTWNNIAQLTALRNNDEVSDILGQLLIDKIQSESDYDSILISQTVKLLQNISNEELKVMALYYLVKNKQICSTSPQILSYLLDFDITRCKEYASSLISNGIAYKSGGFASYIKSEEQGCNEEYIARINDLFDKFPIFINFVVLECGKIITEKYLNCLSLSIL